MLIKIKKLIFILLVLLQSEKIAISNEANIKIKINNEIITNIDIQTELNYLINLNPNLKNISKDTLYKISKDSLINEKIKKKEVYKYFKQNQNNTLVHDAIKQIYTGIGINSVEDFKNYIKKINLDYSDIYSKIEIEILWNQLIYSKYVKQIKIDKDDLKKKIINQNKNHEILKLSEIVYEVKKKDDINKFYNLIVESIKNIGFKETALLYSISQSKKNSGELGWIKKSNLTQIIKNQIEIIDINQITKPIQIPSGILILKLEDKKIIEEDINIDDELKKMIEILTNDQLKNYSNIYFNKIKKNYIINEF